jgi:hypothetical protein
MKMQLVLIVSACYTIDGPPGKRDRTCGRNRIVHLVLDTQGSFIRMLAHHSLPRLTSNSL